MLDPSKRYIILLDLLMANIDVLPPSHHDDVLGVVLIVRAKKNLFCLNNKVKDSNQF